MPKKLTTEDMHRNNWCGDSTHVIAMEAGLPYDKNRNRNRKVAESIKFLESIGLVISRQPQDGKKSVHESTSTPPGNGE